MATNRHFRQISISYAPNILIIINMPRALTAALRNLKDNLVYQDVSCMRKLVPRSTSLLCLTNK